MAACSTLMDNLALRIVDSSLQAVEKHVSEEARVSEIFTGWTGALDRLDYDRCGSLVSIAGWTRRKFCFLLSTTALMREHSSWMWFSSSDSQL